MTDKQRIIEMFNRAGIVYEDKPRTDKNGQGTSITVEAEEGEKNWGYFGFVAILYFNPDESLDAVGVWE